MRFLLWTLLLRRIFQSWSVVLTCALVWFTNYDLLFHVGESRFYGQYILGSVLVLWCAVRAEQGDLPPWKAFLLSLFGAILLAGSQVLGFYWVASAIFAQVLTRRFKPAKIASMVGFVLSGLQLVMYRSLFTTSRQIANWWIKKPTLGNLAREYAGPSFRGHVIAAAMFITVGFALMRLRARTRDGQEITPTERSLLVLLFVFACAPFAFFVISRNVQSIFLPRYMLPTLIALSGLLAWGASEVWTRVKPHLRVPLRRAIVVAAVLFVAFLHLESMREEASSYDEFSKLSGLENMRGDAPVLFEDMVTQEQLHLYRPAVASRFYVTLHANQMHSFMTMDMSYWPYWKEEVNFFQTHPHVVLIDTPWAREMGLTHYLDDPTWMSRRLPDLKVGSSTFPAWDLVRRDQGLVAR